MGYDVSVEDGHFISRDGRHAMVIIQTPVPMMDGQRSKELVSALQDKLNALPSYITADVVSGHLHTVSNEKMIKRDIMVASSIASIAFLLLFLLVFRDTRVLIVFIIPLIAVVWAIIISTAVEGRLSYLVIGFGTAIAGISIDYGLLVYIAMKRGADASQTVKLAKLVFIDAITTMFSFFVLYFSLIRGYHQLALFSMLCVLICLLFSLFVLPLTLSWKNYALVSDPTVGDRFRRFRWPAAMSVAIWAILTLGALYFSFSIQFDSDVKKLDGSEPKVLLAERTFHDVWGGKTNQSIFVVTGKSYEDAMEANDRIFQEASKTVGSGNFSSLALFWSSEKSRKENGERWDRFWKQGREKKLKRLINETSVAYRFSDHAFAPFFDGLYAHRFDSTSPDGLITRLQERFVVNKNGEYRILSFFPDEQQYVDSLTAIAQKHSGAFIVSGKALSSSISDFTAREIRVLAPLAVAFNVILAWLFFRNWKETLIALVPVVTGIVWLVGIMSLFKIPLNVVNIVATIISTGVIVDYGLGITYEYRYNLRIGTIMAVTLSAAANVIGCGALLFAKHPALYSTGVAMVICMVTGYLSSLIVIPSLCSIMGTAKEEIEPK
jgi:predicted exporter